MGFLRRLFGAKKAESSPPAKNKRRWSFNRSSNNPIPSQSQSQSIKRDATYGDNDNNNNSDSNKHAIAVAAATAAVAEAALAAAQAAAEVVRLTGGNGGGRSQFSANRRRWMVEFAAVKIQSAFRGYLARRALRALKALVKLQALVRGHIVRKQTADMLRRMQTLVRLQARARANRSHLTESWRSAANSSLSNHSRCGSSSNFRDIIHLDEAKLGANWLDHWMEESLRNNNGNAPTRNRQEDEKSDKILEVDTWKPHKKSQSIGTFKTSQHVFTSDYNRSFAPFDSPSKISTKATNPYTSSGEDVSLNSLKYPLGKDEAAYRAVDNSPRVFSPSSRPGSSSSRKGTFTPTRSECSWGVFSGYSGYPNYMANTESFRAKLRSQSAPRQRLEFEKYGMMNRSMQESCYDADTISERGYYAQQTSSRNRAQPSSLNRIGSTNLR